MKTALQMINLLLRSQMHGLAPNWVNKPTVQQIQTVLTRPGQPFEIETITLSGNLIKSWKNAHTTLAATVEASKDFGDREYIVFQGERLTYREHYRQVARLANHLIDEFGIQKGDRVAIAMRNYPEWSVAFWAAAAAGAVVVPMNAWWTSAELEYGLVDSGSRILIVDEQRLACVRKIESSLPVEHIVATRCEQAPEGVIALETLLATGVDDRLPHVDLTPEDNATLFYTSGTTGYPKGTLGTQRNFCSAAKTVPFCALQSLLRSGAGVVQLARIAKNPQVALLSVPLFHVTGCQALMSSLFSSGGKMVMMYKWDPSTAVDLIEREGVTGVGGVPTMTRQLVDLPGIDKRNLSSITSVASGGAPVPPELLRRIRKTIPGAGVSNGYGITEASSAISSISGSDYDDRPESAGVPAPVCEIKIVDEKGKELPAGKTGELWVRGPNVVRGYWNKPDATEEAFVDGWFRTGDVCRIDEEGFIYIVDRLKDMIIRGGENIYCAEVEAALSEHPDVNVACVFGIPDRVMGELVGAVVEIPKGQRISAEELQKFVGQRISAFKVPSTVWIRDEPLPLGATGKVQKRELREFYIKAA